MIVKYLFIILIISSCANGKNNNSKKYKFKSDIKVIVNGEDRSEYCSISFNRKSVFDSNGEEINPKKENHIIFSSKSERNEFNQIDCSTGSFLNREINYTFLSREISFIGDKNSIVDLGKMTIYWNTESHVKGFAPSVAAGMVMGGATLSASRSTASFIIHYDEPKNKKYKFKIAKNYFGKFAK